MLLYQTETTAYRCVRQNSARGSCQLTLSGSLRLVYAIESEADSITIMECTGFVDARRPKCISGTHFEADEVRSATLGQQFKFSRFNYLIMCMTTQHAA